MSIDSNFQFIMWCKFSKLLLVTLFFGFMNYARFLSFLLLFFASVTAYAQTLHLQSYPSSPGQWVYHPDVGFVEISTFPQEDYSKVTRIDVVRGSPYLHDEFKIGTVYYNGLTEVSLLPLRFNILTSEFEVAKNDSIYVFAEPEQIDRILLEGEVFTYITDSEKHDLQGFVKMWGFELPTIVTRMKKYIEEVNYVKHPHLSFDYTNPVSVLPMRDEHYVMKSETQATRIRGIKRKADLTQLAAEVSSQSLK